MTSPHKAGRPSSSTSIGWLCLAAIIVVVYFCGYAIGVIRSTNEASVDLSPTGAVQAAVASGIAAASSVQATGLKNILSKLEAVHALVPKWKGDTIHTLFTADGSSYQNLQSRMLYQTYKMVQRQPGGERLTGFTRILHRTVPDVLMDEIPTFLAYPIRPECDTWCDYPAANRPPAIKAFFDAVRQNESMIQGAWVFMLETDYVWMQPMQLPGSAWDPSVPGVMFMYDYINPTWDDVAKQLAKLYSGNTSLVPRTGPSPALLRLTDWYLLAPAFVEASHQMEKEEEMKKALGWVREMYAWGVAVANHHRQVHYRVEDPDDSTTIIQPPFAERLGRAALCHYTWATSRFDKPPSKNGTEVYKWDKRDWREPHQALKPQHVPLPPNFTEGQFLHFDAPLTLKNHQVTLRMMEQMNLAIDQLPDLTEQAKQFEPTLQRLISERDAKVAAQKSQAAAGSGKVALRRLLSSS